MKPYFGVHIDCNVRLYKAVYNVQGNALQLSDILHGIP